MKTFIISDTHFGHENIIKYCNRPFANREEMDKELIKRWNSVVGKDDIVYHLGDFAMGSKDYITDIVRRLNGRIRLITGNHDNYPVKFYYECGFDRVYDRPIIVDDYFILSHHPRTYGADFYGYFYGHVHDDEIYKDVTSNSMCVCVERIDYKPIDFEEAKSLMSNYDRLKSHK